MFHTLELAISLPWYKCRAVREREDCHNHNEWIFHTYEPMGITLSFRKQKIPPGSELPDMYRFKLQLNPAKLLGKERFSITEEADMEEVNRAFTEIFPQCFEGMPDSLTDWKLTRIDYAYEILTKPYTTGTGASVADLYTILLQRGRLPHGYEPYIPENPMAGSLYLKKKGAGGTDLRRINFYHKFNEMYDKFKSGSDPGISAKRSLWLLRFEVQMIGSLRGFRQYHKELELERDVNLYATHAIASNIVGRELLRVEVPATYRTYRATVERVKAESKQVKTRERRLAIVESIKNGGSLAGIEKRLSDKERGQFRRDLQWFREHDINPVTIPLDYCIDTLPAASALLQEAIEAETSSDNVPI